MMSAEVGNCFMEIWKFLSQDLLDHLVTGEPGVQAVHGTLGVSLNRNQSVTVSVWSVIANGD